MQIAMLQPVVVLIAWSLVMLIWAVARRLPAMRAAGVDLKSLVGTKTGDADRVLPPGVNWAAHNYNHLMEQPTIFYAAAFVIALTGTGYGFNVALAWGYVAFRIAHSLVQATINRVAIRLPLFGLSTLCLAALTLHAAMAVFHG